MDLSSWLWIALFIAFISGWFIARYDVKSLLQKNKKLPNQYFKGLQYLLNEQPDKAIDSFIEIAQLDPETVDLHFALGQMFRKRGEFNRSIRIHESLANRGLDNDSKEKALIALGEDYYKAGMFDRAENMFNLFINHSLYHEISVKYLLIIAKLEQDWEKAVELAQFLPLNIKDKPVFHLRLQYVEDLISKCNYDKAYAQLKVIDINYHSHIRYKLVQSYLYIKQNNIDKAIAVLKKLAMDNPKSVSFILIFLQKYAQNLLQSFFISLSEKINNPIYYSIQYKELEKILAQEVNEDKKIEILDKMQMYLEKELTDFPSSEVLRKYAHFLLLKNPYIEQNMFLNKMIEILQQTSHNKYICHECGFRAKEFSWACHGCGEWESLEPITS